MSLPPETTPAGGDRVILTLSCPDQRGIVHRVTGVLAALECNITESQQFGDRYTKRFFMRVFCQIGRGSSFPPCALSSSTTAPCP